MKKVGMITIGQAPRDDITSDIKSMCSSKFTYIQKGVLDNLTYDEVIERFSPNDNKSILVTKMSDGRQVNICSNKINETVQNLIYELEKEDCDIIVLLCTGKFPVYKHTVPLFKPCTLLNSITCELGENGPIGLVLSDAKLVEEFKRRWAKRNIEIVVEIASPYENIEKTDQAVRNLVKKGANIILLDSIGYSIEAKKRVRKITGKPVLSSITMIARILDDIS